MEEKVSIGRYCWCFLVKDCEIGFRREYANAVLEQPGVDGGNGILEDLVSDELTLLFDRI